MLNPSRDRLIHTIAELDEVLRASATRPLPFGLLFLAEGLEDESAPVQPRYLYRPSPCIEEPASDPAIQGCRNTTCQSVCMMGSTFTKAA